MSNITLPVTPPAAPACAPRVPPPDFGALAALARNIIFILGAAVSFALWLSSTITTPKRLDKLEAQMFLLHGDLKEIKAAVIKKI